MKRKVFFLAKLATCLVLICSVLGQSAARAQQDAQYFAETGKTLTGRFLEYWRSHGGLPQQGFPISDIMSELSTTDGKIYTVQYFERAVFEAHPENASPNDVLLSLLGVFRYQEKYPGGAPAQVPNSAPNLRMFPETGKRVGGLFLDYWNTHGGLAQQGLPISDEFIETSALDGKQYKVQYFERAVFEYHPEYTGTAYEVLLAQLGKFRYDGTRAVKTPTPQPTLQPTAIIVQPTAVPANTAVAQPDCSGIPPSPDIRVSPNCGPFGTTFQYFAPGFKVGEQVDGFITRPDGTTGSLGSAHADNSGNVTELMTRAISPAPGVWSVTMIAPDSGRRVVGYFKVTGPDYSLCPDGPPPPNRDAAASPVCGNAGGLRVEFAARGFRPGENVGVYLTQPGGTVFGARFQEVANADGYVIGTYFDFGPGVLPGVWAMTYEGLDSRKVAVAYFKVYKP